MQGRVSATDAETDDFGVSDSLDVVPSAMGDLPDLEHTIFLVREESEAEKRPWSPTRQARDSFDGQSESSSTSPLQALRPSTGISSQMTTEMGSLKIFSENRSSGSGISDGSRQPGVANILEYESGNEGVGEQAVGELNAEDVQTNAELSRVLGEGESLMAALGEEKTGEVLRGEFKGYEAGVEVTDSNAEDTAKNDGQAAVSLSTPAATSGVDAGSEDRRSESAKKLARLVEEGETLVSAIPEESAAALLEALQEGKIRKKFRTAFNF